MLSSISNCSNTGAMRVPFKVSGLAIYLSFQSLHRQRHVKQYSSQMLFVSDTPAFVAYSEFRAPNTNSIISHNVAFPCTQSALERTILHDQRIIP